MDLTLAPPLKRLTARGRLLAQQLKPQSLSTRNVLKLAGGTAGSQLIAVASAPILARLYGPQSFGVLATFASLLGLLNVVSSFRYELAIVVPEDDDEAASLVWLCCVLVLISTCLTALGVVLLGRQLLDWLNQPLLKPLLWLLPVGVLLSGMYQPLSYWAIRRKQFGLLARSRFRQSICGVATTLCLAPLGTIGLLLGQIVTQSSGFIEILRSSGTLLLRPSLTRAVLVQTLRRYRHFGIYDSLAGLINAVGSQVPNLIIASIFGVTQFGQLNLAQRLLLFPSSLIASSVGQVFLNQVAANYRECTLPQYIRQASQKLFLYSTISACGVYFLVVPIIPFVFGQKWELTQRIIPLLIPMFIGELVVSPLSNAFVGSQKLRLALVFQTFLMTFKIAPLLLVSSSHDLLLSLTVYSISCGIGYLAYLVGIQLFVARLNTNHL
jgi:O-antigen/teichoic acid export membrane protein